MDPIVNGEVDFIHPFLNFESEETISYRLVEELSKKFSLPKAKSSQQSMTHGMNLLPVSQDMRNKGEETIRFLNETGNRGIVLAGRPYHIDPEVNHGLPELITFLQYCRTYRRLCLPSESGRASSECHGSVDVPLPTVCCRKLCKDNGES